MVDLTSHGVSFALLQGELLAGEISHSAFLDRASPLGAGTCEAAVADNVLAIAANQAARQKDLKSSYDYIVVRLGAAGSVVARRLTTPTMTRSRIYQLRICRGTADMVALGRGSGVTHRTGTRSPLKNGRFSAIPVLALRSKPDS